MTGDDVILPCCLATGETFTNADHDALTSPLCMTQVRAGDLVALAQPEVRRERLRGWSTSVTSSRSLRFDVRTCWALLSSSGELSRPNDTCAPKRGEQRSGDVSKRRSGVLLFLDGVKHGLSGDWLAGQGENTCGVQKLSIFPPVELHVLSLVFSMKLTLRAAPNLGRKSVARDNKDVLLLSDGFEVASGLPNTSLVLAERVLRLGDVITS